MPAYANGHESTPRDGQAIDFELCPSALSRPERSTGIYRADTLATSPTGHGPGAVWTPSGRLRLAEWGPSVLSWQPAGWKPVEGAAGEN
jgi:hypothetical protein